MKNCQIQGGAPLQSGKRGGENHLKKEKKNEKYKNKVSEIYKKLRKLNFEKSQRKGHKEIAKRVTKKVQRYKGSIERKNRETNTYYIKTKEVSQFKIYQKEENDKHIE